MNNPQVGSIGYLYGVTKVLIKAVRNNGTPTSVLTIQEVDTGILYYGVDSSRVQDTERATVELSDLEEEPAPAVVIPKPAQVLDPITSQIFVHEPRPRSPKRTILRSTGNQEFVAYLLSTDTRIKMQTRSAERGRALETYREWSGGEDFPEELISIHESWDTEFWMDFPYDSSVEYPFPIVEEGTTGKGNVQPEPQGIYHHASQRVTMCYQSVIEFAVRRGLRPHLQPEKNMTLDFAA